MPPDAFIFLIFKGVSVEYIPLVSKEFAKNDLVSKQLKAGQEKW